MRCVLQAAWVILSSSARQIVSHVAGRLLLGADALHPQQNGLSRHKQPAPCPGVCLVFTGAQQQAKQQQAAATAQRQRQQQQKPAGGEGAEGGSGGEGQQAPPVDERTWLQKNWLMLLCGGMMVRADAASANLTLVAPG